MRTLKPGQDGTKELLKRSGPTLLTARYRYDEDRREHVKTLELVVQRRPRDTEAAGSGPWASGAREPLETGAVKPSGAGGFASRRVAPRIGWQETCSSR